MTLTAEKLREYLAYDPLTGVFTYRVRRGRYVPGRVAGKTDADGYRSIMVETKSYFAHRLAWLHLYGEWPPSDLDHRNLDRRDNRIENLRPATRTQNNANCPRKSLNKSGFKGVCWNKQSGKWQAGIKSGGKSRYLGMFATAEEAHAAYLKAAAELFGEFARAA